MDIFHVGISSTNLSEDLDAHPCHIQIIDHGWYTTVLLAACANIYCDKLRPKKFPKTILLNILKNSKGSPEEVSLRVLREKDLPRGLDCNVFYWVIFAAGLYLVVGLQQMEGATRSDGLWRSP